MRIEDLGLTPYRQALDLQEEAHAQVLTGGEERVFFVEHPPVITFGRRPGVERNVVAAPEMLRQLGVDVVPTDRGGDVTFHGPGQLVVYPIIRLADHGLTVSSFVHGLERMIIDLLAGFGIAAHADPAAVGVWADGAEPAKIAAIGVRIRRGISMHGLALNISTHLEHFELIVPCGLADKRVTSMRALLGDRSPDMTLVKAAMVGQIQIAWSGEPRLAQGR